MEENIELINGANEKDSLPWLVEIFCVPIRDLIPGTLRIKTGKTLQQIAVPPATAYIEVVPENITIYNVTVGIPFPYGSNSLSRFLNKNRGMELFVIAKDRNDITFFLGDHIKGLKVSHQYSNSAQTRQTVVLSNKLSTLGFTKSTNFDVQSLFQGEFSIEFSNEFNL